MTDMVYIDNSQGWGLTISAGAEIDFKTPKDFPDKLRNSGFNLAVELYERPGDPKFRKLRFLLGKQWFAEMDLHADKPNSIHDESNGEGVVKFRLGSDTRAVLHANPDPDMPYLSINAYGNSIDPRRHLLAVFVGSNPVLHGEITADSLTLPVLDPSGGGNAATAQPGDGDTGPTGDGATPQTGGEDTETPQAEEGP